MEWCLTSVDHKSRFRQRQFCVFLRRSLPCRISTCRWLPTRKVSTLGIGGVVGAQFVLPALVEKHGRFDLTPGREKIFQKWLDLYQQKGLSHGRYLGTLYDIGFDLPEAHVIRKDKKMYYAFFAQDWKGAV
jgi:hypothetical protein